MRLSLLMVIGPLVPVIVDVTYIPPSGNAIWADPGIGSTKGMCSDQRTTCS